MAIEGNELPNYTPDQVRKVVYELWKSGEVKQADIARQVRRTRARVGQLVAQFRRLHL